MAQARGSCLSLLRNNDGGDDNGDSLILQEMWNDATSSLLVYVTVDIPMMELAMSEGDSSFVALLPSGFTIFPNGYNGGGDDEDNGAGTTTGGGVDGGKGGCIMTVGFQILASTVLGFRVRRNSVNTVKTFSHAPSNVSRTLFRLLEVLMMGDPLDRIPKQKSSFLTLNKYLDKKKTLNKYR
ncbi:Homeobox-leucine zipper protein HDG7 [Linum perenne]